MIAYREAGVVDEKVKKFDLVDSAVDPLRIGHVQCERRDALVRVRQGWRVAASTRFAPLSCAASTNARPSRRFAPVTRTALSTTSNPVIGFLHCAIVRGDKNEPARWPPARMRSRPPRRLP